MFNLTKRIAAELGSGFTAVDDRFVRTDYEPAPRTFESRGKITYALGIIRIRHNEALGVDFDPAVHRIVVYGLYPDYADGSTYVFRSTDFPPRITVKGTASPKTIARHIKRRFLPPYESLLETVLTDVGSWDAYLDKRSAQFDTIEKYTQGERRPHQGTDMISGDNWEGQLGAVNGGFHKLTFTNIDFETAMDLISQVEGMEK